MLKLNVILIAPLVTILLVGCSGPTPGREDALNACAYVSIAGEEVIRLGEGEEPQWTSAQFQGLFETAISSANEAATANEDFQQLGLISRQLERKIENLDPEFVLDLLSLEMECEQLGLYG